MPKFVHFPLHIYANQCNGGPSHPQREVWLMGTISGSQTPEKTTHTQTHTHSHNPGQDLRSVEVQQNINYTTATSMETMK